MAKLSETTPAFTPTPAIIDDPDRARRGALGVTTGPVARTLFAIPFLVFGLNHFLMTKQMAALVPEWLGAPSFWVYLTGAAMIAGAIAIVTGRFIIPAAIGLASMLAVFILTIHIPGMMHEQTMQLSMISALKDFALGAAALMTIRAVGHDPTSA
ncbi:hypothetical protein ENSA5_48650 [Enhygromyxa salina]|uniref:DoxX family protein n=2 Tax=Enhygromyxa salina TaxID=215803 RepID=A0A2S9XHY9_9BACT|nr:hypothetical protein ENSA5_48650 [Enhygromyxa salina]